MCEIRQEINLWKIRGEDLERERSALNQKIAEFTRDKARNEEAYKSYDESLKELEDQFLIKEQEMQALRDQNALLKLDIDKELLKN